MQRNVVHVPRPHQQGIGAIRRSLVAVPAAFHHQPQIVFPRKIDRRRDVLSIPCRHGIRARPRRPGVHPAQRLRHARTVADVVRIFQIGQQRLAPFLLRRARARGHWRIDRNQIAANLVIQAFPRRLRRPARIAGPHAWRRAYRRTQPSPPNSQKRRRPARLQEPSAIHLPSPASCLASADMSSLAICAVFRRPRAYVTLRVLFPRSYLFLEPRTS